VKETQRGKKGSKRENHQQTEGGENQKRTNWEAEAGGKSLVSPFKNSSRDKGKVLRGRGRDEEKKGNLR